MEAHGTIYTWYARVVSNSAVMERICFDLGEYRINKYLTGVQAQATSHCECESTNAQCVLPGTHYSM